MTEELVPIALFAAIVYIIKTISDNRVRKLLIEKGKVDQDLAYLYQAEVRNRVPSSLKWGLVSIAIGVALLLSSGWSEELKFATMFIFAGCALVLYYFIASAMLPKQKQQGQILPQP